MPLAQGTNYTVTVSTGVKDVAGNALAAQFTSTFNTQPAPRFYTLRLNLNF